jgi:hypothetical protein
MQRIVLMVGALYCLGFHDLVAQPIGAADTAGISCRIRPEKPVCKQGETVNFIVELWNKSAATQVLAYAVDGSEVGWRCPTVNFTVYQLGRSAQRTLVKPDRHMRCGNTDAMLEQDFVLVPPGGMMQPCAGSRYNGMHNWFGFQYLSPGEYEVIFTYATKPTDNARWWLAADEQELPATTGQARKLHTLLKQVPTLVVRSNTAHLTIVK